MNLKAQTVYVPIGMSEETLNKESRQIVVGSWTTFIAEKRTAIVLSEEELQQEKDKFAVEFAEWCSINGWKYSASTLKLLDIYKKELANHITTKEKV